VRAHETERGERWAAIACLPETRQEGFHGQVCYDQDESEERGKESKCEVEVNVVLLATDLRGDEDGVQSEEFLLSGIDVRDSDHEDNEGGEGAAMFDVGV